MVSGTTTKTRHAKTSRSTMRRIRLCGGVFFVLLALAQMAVAVPFAHADPPSESSAAGSSSGAPASSSGEPEGSAITGMPPVVEPDGPARMTDRSQETASQTSPEIAQTESQPAWMPMSLSMSPVLSGTYVIHSALSDNQVIDIPGASAQAGVGLQLFQENGTDAQKFQVTCGQDDWCSIKNARSGMALDVKWAFTSDETVVWQYDSNSTNAQKWRFLPNTDGTVTIESALRAGLVLDVKNGYRANGTPLQTYSSNGTNAQRFRLAAASTGVASQRTLDDGVYVFSSRLGNNLVLDVPGASTSPGQGTQIYTANKTVAQSFQVRWVSGYYHITSLASGLRLVPSRGADTPCTLVVQDGSVSGDAQFWSISRNADSTYSIVSKTSGLVWDVQWALAKSGAPLQLYTANGTAAQKFTVSLAPTPVLSNGAYYTLSTPRGNVIDVSGDRPGNGTRIGLYSPNGTNAQKWKALTRSDSSVALVGGTYDKAMDVDGARTADGTAIQEYDQNGTKAQSWTLIPAGDGGFYLQNGVGTYAAYASDTSGTLLTTTQNISAAGRFTPTSTTAFAPLASHISIVAKIKQIAWPDRSHSLYDPKPEYRSALAAVGLSTYPDQYAKIGASCDSFVATVLRSTGLDTKYQCCGAGNQMNYLRAHPEKYQRIANNLNTSNLLPGDIFVSSQHTLLYIGNGQEASASYSQRTASYGYSISFKDSQATPYEIYRYIG